MVSNVVSKVTKLLISPKTSIGGYVFDVYTNINHNLTSTITSHPTQFGANISDHKFDEPDQLTFQIGMSDASINLLGSTFVNNETLKYKAYNKLTKAKMLLSSFVSDSRSVNAFNVLNTLKLAGVPLSCSTRLKTYDNMIIQSITVDDTNETKYGLRANVVMREILVSELEVIQVNSTAQITQTTNKGATNVLDFDLASKKAFTSTDFDEYGLGDF